jgi:hypothetical protein
MILCPCEEFLVSDNRFIKYRFSVGSLFFHHSFVELSILILKLKAKKFSGFTFVTG